jgi:hypothetical protein
MIAKLVFQTVYDKLDNVHAPGDVYIDDEDLFEIINEFIENGGEQYEVQDLAKHVVRLNNFNYYDKQELFLLDSDDEYTQEPEVIESLEQLIIEP